MTVSDDQTTPEARAALRAAATVVPHFPRSPEDCDHPEPVEIGRGFEGDVHTITAYRCPQCGNETITEESQ